MGGEGMERKKYIQDSCSAPTPDTLQTPPWGPEGLRNIQIDVRHSRAGLLFCFLIRTQCSGQLPQPSPGVHPHLVPLPHL